MDNLREAVRPESRVESNRNSSREEQLRRYDVLGHGSGRDLQALVDLAAQICEVPNAAINLISASEQHQIATAGFEPSVCARADSMCAAVLEDTNVVLVPDASADHRFQDNPFVTGAIGEVRFYASAPLITPQGVVIGRLCVFDDQPRTLSPEREATLTVLAERVVDLLELRLRERELKASLAALTDARDDLHRSNELLALFAGQISHDLRTPLSAIMASAELLSQEPAVAQDPALERLALTAYRASGRMAAMIDAILDFALVGATLQIEESDLNDVLGGVLEDLTPMLRAQGARVLPDDLPVVQVDRQQLYAVLLNLMTNAVKFTRPSVGPVIEVSSRREESGWRISVRDNGIGIAPEHRDKAFALFGRVGGSVEGSGVGLATARRIVEAHGGAMGIEQADPHGTVVWLTIPDRDLAPSRH